MSIRRIAMARRWWRSQVVEAESTGALPPELQQWEPSRDPSWWYLAVPTQGPALCALRNAAGNTIVRLSSSTSGGMTSGFISVRSAAGTETVGINGRTGNVFGNTKSFIVPDPAHPGRKIRHTSLEGPEAGIYVRGRAEFLKGQAIVEFPDHFAALGVESSITVTLTPHSADSLGLAVVEVSPEEVRELQGGQGSYPFDYVAYGIQGLRGLPGSHRGGSVSDWGRDRGG